MVTWVNKSTRKSWPASNPHPLHTSYPRVLDESCEGTFDACRALSDNEHFQFRFEEPGTWEYHDHLFPTHLGTVIVEANINAGPTSWKQRFVQTFASMVDVFKKLLFDEDFKTVPYERQLQMIQNISAEKSWALVQDAYLVNGAVVGNAHELAHAVGNKAYQERGFEGVAICTPVLAYGCYHGVTEQFLLEKGEKAIAEAENACERLFTVIDNRYGSCVHGMGHGIVVWKALEISPALSLCDALKPSNQNYCYDGVFMEYFSANQVNSIDDPAHLWDLCTNLPEKYQVSCVKYQILEANRVLENDIGRLLTWCESSSSKTLKEECTRSTGHSIGIAYWQDPVAVVSLCTSAHSMEIVSLCITSAAQELTFQKYAGWEDNAQVLCDTLLPDASLECHKFTSSI